MDGKPEYTVLVNHIANWFGVRNSAVFVRPLVPKV